MKKLKAKTWPVPNSYYKEVPKEKELGGFWENRGEFRHCGVDIYAPPGSAVHSISSGQVVEIGEFSSPDKRSYWNNTYYLVVKTPDDYFIKYAELDKLFVELGEIVRKKQSLATVGQIINPKSKDPNIPEHAKELIKSEKNSMLHLEVYKDEYILEGKYEGGNLVSQDKPEILINPADIF